jgi:hypothetical protein
MMFVEIKEGVLVNLDRVSSTYINDAGDMFLYPAESSTPVVTVPKELVPAMLKVLRRTDGHIYLPLYTKSDEERGKRSLVLDALAELEDEKSKERARRQYE